MQTIRNYLILFVFSASAVLLATCESATKDAPVLLFNGKGASPKDVEAIKNILSSSDIDFNLINSDELNEMTRIEMNHHKLIIIPGGDFIEISKNLSPKTISNVQTAVHHGLNYLGICAGGFLAGYIQDNGSFNLTDGIQFKFYSAEYNGTRKQSVAVTNANGKMIEHYWEDGPQLSGWGDVVSKYPDDTPATIQGEFGSGLVILTGVHPEAPENWRREFHFSTSIEDSHAYAADLIKAALDGKEMAHF